MHANRSHMHVKDRVVHELSVGYGNTRITQHSKCQGSLDCWSWTLYGGRIRIRNKRDNRLFSQPIYDLVRSSRNLGRECCRFCIAREKVMNKFPLIQFLISATSSSPERRSHQRERERERERELPPRLIHLHYASPLPAENDESDFYLRFYEFGIRVFLPNGTFPRNIHEVRSTW